jgi:hypothetical protein
VTQIRGTFVNYWITINIVIEIGGFCKVADPVSGIGQHARRSRATPSRSVANTKVTTRWSEHRGDGTGIHHWFERGGGLPVYGEAHSHCYSEDHLCLQRSLGTHWWRTGAVKW